MKKTLQMSGRTGVLLMVLLLLIAMIPQLCFADAMVEKEFEHITDADFYVKVNASDGGANLRGGPSTDYDILVSMMPNGTVIHINSTCKASNGKTWGFGEYNGTWGWVALSQCEETSIHKDVAPPPTQKVLAELVDPDVMVDYDVNVNAPDGGVNFRYGPGKDYQQVFAQMIGNGTKLHISGEKKAANGKLWGLAEYNGDLGWVFLGQCDKLTDTADTPDTEENEGIALADEKDGDQPAQSGSSMIRINTVLLMVLIGLFLLIIILSALIVMRRKR